MPAGPRFRASGGGGLSGLPLPACRFRLAASGFRACRFRASGLPGFRTSASGFRASGFRASGLPLPACRFGLPGFGLPGFGVDFFKGYPSSRPCAPKIATTAGVRLRDRDVRGATAARADVRRPPVRGRRDHEPQDCRRSAEVAILGQAQRSNRRLARYFVKSRRWAGTAPVSPASTCQDRKSWRGGLLT